MQYEREPSYSYSIEKIEQREESCRVGRSGMNASAAKTKGRQKIWRPLFLRNRPGGGETYRLGLGAVLCAELGVSVPRTLVIRRTSTRRFLARPSAVVLGAAYLSLPIPIR